MSTGVTPVAPTTPPDEHPAPLLIPSCFLGGYGEKLAIHELKIGWKIKLAEFFYPTGNNRYNFST